MSPIFPPINKWLFVKVVCVLAIGYMTVMILFPNKRFCRYNVCDYFNNPPPTKKPDVEIVTKIEKPTYDQEFPPMDSPDLVSYIQGNILIAPPAPNVPLNLENTSVKYNAQIGQDRIVERILDGKRRGFFIESGAQRGELLSNTLYFERFLQWTGLLVEPSVTAFEILASKRRKSYIANTCLSTRPYPIKIGFNGNQLFEPGIELTREHAIAEVTCYPLFSLLLAMQPPMLNIDYFSLDIDGPELQILQTIPWNRVNITVISVEVRHSPFPLNTKIRDDIVKLVTSQGYHYITHLFDIIFVRDGTPYDVEAVKRVQNMRNAR